MKTQIMAAASDDQLTWLPHMRYLSISTFKRNANEYLKQMKETQSPVVLTVNGKAELVVQDAESYHALLEVVERAEAIAGVSRGLEQMERGGGKSAGEAFADMRRKLNIPCG